MGRKEEYEESEIRAQ